MNSFLKSTYFKNSYFNINEWVVFCCKKEKYVFHFLFKYTERSGLDIKVDNLFGHETFWSNTKKDIYIDKNGAGTLRLKLNNRDTK